MTPAVAVVTPKVPELLYDSGLLSFQGTDSRQEGEWVMVRRKSDTVFVAE